MPEGIGDFELGSVNASKVRFGMIPHDWSSEKVSDEDATVTLRS